MKDGLLRLAAKPMPDSLDTTDLNILQNQFSKLEDVNHTNITICTIIKKHPFIIRKFGSEIDQCQKKTIVLAKWPINSYGVPMSLTANLSLDITGKFYLRPSNVTAYLEIDYCVRGSAKTIILAKGCWPKYSNDYMHFGKPYTVWRSELVESKCCISSFITIDQIVCNCAHLNTSISNIGMLCVCPITF